ncbi:MULTISPECIES: glycosyltransferase [Thiorhodovibrio]|uniref:glycosyltransferase n=1 Tax=Thiorhodovibrio TaxID=61593 RepID=UPI001911D4C9|nr:MULTISPECIES: hypothetical protein [Thiorhodovibrio]MBK5970947.1 hypothetical protein [Thiorhodovibrio winogradskyi]WPL10687.1 hypothetical protein Thiosp_00404 [Thiorhodovibrio litoralis]
MTSVQTVDIVATAALPWRTGTAVLALLRAFYLARRGLDVHLYLPWIVPWQQRELFGDAGAFDTEEEQAAHIRSSLPEPGCPDLHLRFYPARYWPSLGSILPACALPSRLRPCDWLILEEPEHLNWTRPWSRYRSLSPRVTGMVLTNYRYYCAHAFPAVRWVADLLERYDRWLIRRLCDHCIVLGNSITGLPDAGRFLGSGVHPKFFSQAGRARTGLYFMGKLIWEKGFRDLVDLLAAGGQREIDVFGRGRDQDAIADYARERGVRLYFKGVSTRPALDIARYKIFVNPSRSEGLCTTTAEALAQRKFVIIPRHASNALYDPFGNALVYDSPETFQACLRHAMTHQPEVDPLEESLSWEAAIDRLLADHGLPR